MKILYAYTILLFSFLVSCSKTNESELLLNDGQITLSLDLIREFSLQLDNSSYKSFQLEDSDFVHVYGNEITVNFISVPPGYIESLTFNPNDNTQRITLPYGEYNWEIPSDDNPSPISNTLSVSGQSTSVILINEPTVDLTLNVNSDYALVTLNDDYTSNVTLTHEELSVSMNNKDGYNYGYVLSGTTSTTLDLIDINGDSYTVDIGLVESCKHYKYQLDYSNLGINSLICLCDPFEVIERFIVPSQSNVFCEESDLPSSLRNGLLGMWTFCGDANDYGSLSNNGTVYGPLTGEGKFGQENTSYDFDGTDDYISLNSPFFNGDTSVSSFTFYTLIKIDNYERSNVFWKEGYWRSIGLETMERRFVFRGSQPSPQSYFSISSTSDYQINTWYNIVITFNNGILKMYINGELNISETIDYNTLNWSYLAQGNSTSSNHIGNGLPNSGPRNHFNGKIDDLMYWNRVLSEEEINLL